MFGRDLEYKAKYYSYHNSCTIEELTTGFCTFWFGVKKMPNDCWNFAAPDCLRYTFWSSPEGLKIGEVILMHKGGDKQKHNNYRPTTIPSVSFKILEYSCLNRDIMTFVDERSILSDIMISVSVMEDQP